MSKDSDQRATAPKKFKLGHLGNLNQVITALGKTIRAMADGTVDSQVGARLCNGLGILRTCLETQTLERLGDRLDQLESKRGEEESVRGFEESPRFASSGAPPMSRTDINRLLRRVDALESKLAPQKATRTFTMTVENHMVADDALARFCAENGVAERDLLIARVMVPHEIWPGEMAADAYRRELVTAARSSTAAT